MEILGEGIALFLISFFLTGRAWFSLMLALFVTFIIIVLHWLNFYKLTVMVDDQRVMARYGVGFIKREFPIAEIVSCEAVRNPIVGLRSLAPWGPVVWPIEKLFSSSDRVVALPLRFRDAVRIQMQNGLGVVIGIAESEQLSNAIHNVMAKMQKS